MLIARGVEHSPLESLGRSFVRPCWDTWTVQFYRPLFSFSFAIDGVMFGAHPWPYYLSNILIHAFCVVLLALVMRRLTTRRLGVIAAALFALSPWCVNNVAWIAGRCSSTSMAFALLACLAAWRHRDQARKGLPWLAFALIATGIFYRETAAFMGALLIGVDVYQGHRSREDIKRWLFLATPFLVYLILRYMVLGTLTGGYDRHHLLRGDPATPADEHLMLVGRSILLLLVPGPADGGWDLLRWMTLAPLIGLLSLAGRPALLVRGAAGVFLVVAVAHAVPLFVVDPTLHPSSSQRWYPVMMAIACWFCTVVSHARWPRLAVIFLAAIAILWGVRLDAHLDNYDASAVQSRAIRDAVSASMPGIVVVHGVSDNLQDSPYFALGLGAIALPPFGSGEHTVYPLSANHPLYAGEASTLPPLGVWMEQVGLPCTLLVQEADTLSVSSNADAYRGSAGRLPALSRLRVTRPSPDQDDGLTALPLDVELGAAKRLEIHFFCTTGHVVLERTPNKLGERGKWGGDGRYTEDLSQLLEYAALFDQRGQRNAFLFLAAYDAAEDGNLIAIMDGFFPLETKIEREKPQ